jgi:uridine phosphorylase
VTTWTSGASRPEQDGLQYHIRCRPGDVARYVLLPGDPTRVPLIAARWAEGREIAVEREHVTFTGTLQGGGPISACSTGAVEAPRPRSQARVPRAGDGDLDQPLLLDRR